METIHVRDKSLDRIRRIGFYIFLGATLFSVFIFVLLGNSAPSDIIRVPLAIVGTITLIIGCTGFALVTVYIFKPTDLAVKIRIKQFTGKVNKGGIGFAIPLLERFVTYDARIQTLWMKFIGVRGTSRNQMKDLDTYKKRVLIVDESQYHLANPEEKFKTSDFYEFGALMTAGREEINILCSINYRILDALKLSRVFDQLENSATEKGKFKSALVTKLASALRSTLARMTLDEIFEERQKLMELLMRDSIDLRDDWGLEVLNVSIEEMWLEDDKLQEMLDERKKYEIIGDARQLNEEHEAEMRNIVIQAEEQTKTTLAKAKEEQYIIQQRTQKELAMLKRELMELQAKAEMLSAETQSKSRKLIAEAEAKRKKLLDEVIDERILQNQLINVLPHITEQLSFDYQKFILVPDRKQGLMNALLLGRGSNQVEEEEYVE